MKNLARRLPVGFAALLLLSLPAAGVLAFELMAGGVGPVVRAQERQAVIHAVAPGHPDCIDIASEAASERTLVITGENLDAAPDAMLQFRRIYAVNPQRSLEMRSNGRALSASRLIWG